MRYQSLAIMMACLCTCLPTPSFAQNNLHNASTHQNESIKTPLHYRIADIDPRFKLTKQQIIELTQQAAEIWERETGKKNFIYDPQAEFTINLVFDDRQQRSLERLQELNQLKLDQSHWEKQNQQLQQFRDEIQKSTVLIATKQTRLAAEFQKYNAEAQLFNQMRSSSKSAAEQLSQRQKNLQQQSIALQQEVQQHNQKTQQLNQEINKLNQNNQKLVFNASQFNQVFQPRLFHKGNFNSKQIDIYEFSSKDDLRLTLAHEFGHALGLEHTDDPTSIMYPVIQKQNLNQFELAVADRELVQSIK